VSRNTGHEQLAAWRDPAREVRIDLSHWLVAEPVTRQFIERPRNLGMVWNYLRRIGPVAVARKIRSRLAESRRNRKIGGVGTGVVVEAPEGSGFPPGQRVVFFAPNHGEDWRCISVDARFVMAAGSGTAEHANVTALPPELKALSGWSPFSGCPVDAAAVRRGLAPFAGMLKVDAIAESALSSLQCRDRIERAALPAGRPTAAIFGLGNYAKTQIVPHTLRHLSLQAVHEIDPDQIMGAAGLGVTLDTNPGARPGERFDAWFVAGFHHTHAALAVRALREGAYAVVEKPLVTTREQLAELQAAMRGPAAAKLFTCFHKRYSKLDEWVQADIPTPRGAPVDMHAIVYEIPLPPLHWYNWPTSGSRLVSNGCHWLDYFLFVNGYSAVCDADVSPMRGSDVLATVRLENGAQLVLSITETGSERLGVRDVIELRAADVTVRLIDAAYYNAESTRRVIRDRRVNPMDAYARMYDTICRRIRAGASGDSPESLRSTMLMLDLEDVLAGKRGAARPQRSTEGS
jgi:predicted dehydrogenase